VKCGKLYVREVCKDVCTYKLQKTVDKLAEKEIDKIEFRKNVALFPNTMTKLNKNEEVSMQIILRICKFLKSNISKICDVVFEEEKQL